MSARFTPEPGVARRRENVSTVAFPRQIAATNRALLTSVDRAPQDARPAHAPPGLPPAGLPPSDAAAAPAAGQLEGSALAARPRRAIQNRGASPSFSAFFLVGTCRDRAIKRFRTPRAPARGARAAGTVAPAAAEAAKVSRTTRSIDGSTTAAVRASLGATRTPPRRGPTRRACRDRAGARIPPVVMRRRGIFFSFSLSFGERSSSSPTHRRARGTRLAVLATRRRRKSADRLEPATPRSTRSTTLSTKKKNRTSRRRKGTSSRITF